MVDLERHFGLPSFELEGMVTISQANSRERTPNLSRDVDTGGLDVENKSRAPVEPEFFLLTSLFIELIDPAQAYLISRKRPLFTS